MLSKWRGTVAGLCAALPVLTAGCVGVELLVKPPIVEGCQQVPLQECEAVADAAVLYLKGDKSAGKERLRPAVAANSPAELRLLADVVSSVGLIPSVKEHASPLFEIAEYISESAAEKQRTGGSGAPSRGGSAGVASAAATPAPTRAGMDRFITADTDVLRLTGGTVAPLTAPERGGCGAMSEASAATCVQTVAGPVVVTDLHATGGCEGPVIVAAGATREPAKEPRWTVIGTGRFTGARLFVRKDETLLLGATGGKTCAVTWAGFRPYYTEE